MESSTLNKSTPAPSFNIEAVRKDFPVLSQTNDENNRIVYLDNAATTLKPVSVIETLREYYEKETANIHRGNHYLASLSTCKFENTRKHIREFINANSVNEIIFTKGTTESINLLANSFGMSVLSKGDVILLSCLEHHSNIVPWQMIAEKTGAVIKVIPINDNGDIKMEDYRAMLNDKVKIVSTLHISNALGTINPVRDMIKLAHDNGSAFILDAAQSFLHEKIDVQKLNADFITFSAHKALGPTGLGVLYGKENLLEKMPPYMGGGEMIHSVDFEKTTFNDLPYKFEAGTPPIAQVIAFNKSLEYIKKIGQENIRNYELELLNYATGLFKEIDGFKFIGTAKQKSAIISFLLDGIHPADCGTLLDKQGFALRTGHHCAQPLMKRLGISGTVRASFCFYNTKEEIDALKEAIIKTQQFY